MRLFVKHILATLGHSGEACKPPHTMYHCLSRNDQRIHSTQPVETQTERQSRRYLLQQHGSRLFAQLWSFLGPISGYSRQEHMASNRHS